MAHSIKTHNKDIKLYREILRSIGTDLSATLLRTNRSRQNEFARRIQHANTGYNMLVKHQDILYWRWSVVSTGFVTHYLVQHPRRTQNPDWLPLSTCSARTTLAFYSPRCTLVGRHPPNIGNLTTPQPTTMIDMMLISMAWFVCLFCLSFCRWPFSR